MFLAVERAHTKIVDGGRRLVRAQLADIRVRVEANVRRGNDRVAILRPEACRRAELPDLGPHNARIERERRHRGVASLPLRRIVLVRPQLEQAMRARVERIEVGARDGPATVRNPRSLLEVEWIQSRAEARPVSRGPTEVVQSRRIQRVIRQARDRTAIEILHRLLECEAAALEQEHRAR